MLTINDLSCDLLVKIFNLIDLVDRLELIRVSKRFQKIIENKIKPLELIIKRPYEYGSDDSKVISWYHTSKKINLNSIVFQSFGSDEHDYLLNSNLLQNFFNKLKFLKINLSGYKNCFDLIRLNQLNELIQLELDKGIILKENVILNLPNLNIFKTHLLNHKLILNSSKLKVLYCNRLREQIELSNPENLISLEIEDLKDELFEYLNLEFLKLHNLIQVDELLNKLPVNLKKLHIIYDYDENEDEDCFFSRKIQLILDYKTKLNLTNLNIYVQGIEIENEQSIDDFDDHDKLTLFYKHFNNLEKIDWLTEINCNQLINLCGYQFSIEFIKKFKNIQFINVNKEICQHYLIQFLQECPNVTKLYLKNALLNQEFYNQLSSIVPLIENFKLIDKTKVNFDFLITFKFLRKINLSNLTTTESAIKILSSLKNLKRFKFLIEERTIIRIERYKDFFQRKVINQNEYLFAFDRKDERYEDLDLNEIIQFLIESNIKNNELFFKNAKKRCLTYF